MPAAATVWVVELQKSPRDRRGELSLEGDALAFTASDGVAHLRIPLSAVRSVKRLRGSPVLMVTHRDEGATTRTAFYFVQPPPLQPPKDAAGERPNLFTGMARSSKRRTRRQNAGYLGMWGREKKGILSEWVDAIRSASGTSRD